MKIKKGQRWKSVVHKSNVTINHVSDGIVFYRLSDDENDYCGMPVEYFIDAYIYDDHVKIGQKWLLKYPDDFIFEDGNVEKNIFVDVHEIVSNGHEARCSITFSDGTTLDDEILLVEGFKIPYWQLVLK